MDKHDRKARIREYQEAARPMGVFRVANQPTGRGVLGTSRDLPSILNRHRAQLSLGSHADKALQSEWDETGGEGFVFEVLDTLEPSDDPGYDPTQDLQALQELWEERLGGGTG